MSTSPRLARLKSDRSRLLWTWMLPHCDRDGRLGGDPVKVRGLVVPELGWSLDDIDSCLVDLQSCGLVKLYTDESGRRVIELPSFREHQAGMRYDRESPSKYGDAGFDPNTGPPKRAAITPDTSGVVRSSPEKLAQVPENAPRRTHPDTSGVVRHKVTEGKLTEGEAEARGREAPAAPAESDPRASRIAAELGRFRVLGPVGGEDEQLALAEALLGVIDPAGVSIDDALPAIAQAAAEIEPGMAAGAIRRKLQVFCRNARPRAQFEHESRRSSERTEYRAGHARRREQAFTRQHELSRTAAASPEQAGAAAAEIMRQLAGGVG